MDRLPPILYHATLPKNVQNILRHGLIPQDESYNLGSDGIHRNRVFLSKFDDPQYMNLSADKVYDAVILAVDTLYLDPSRLYPDDSIYGAYFNDQLEDTDIGAMFPDYYRSWGASGSAIGFGEWMNNPANSPSDDDLENMLAGRFGLTLWNSGGIDAPFELGEVGYEGRIPPEAINLRAPVPALRSAALRVGGQYLYHSTLADYLLEIAEDGLDPFYGGRNFQGGPKDSDGWVEGKLFFSDDPQKALYYGENAMSRKWTERKTPPVLLRVTKSAIEVQPDQYGDFYTEDSVPASIIEVKAPVSMEVGSPLAWEPLTEELAEDARSLFCGDYLGRDKPLFLAPDFSPKKAAIDEYIVELTDNDHGGVTAFLAANSGVGQVEDAYADIHMGMAEEFQGDTHPYNYFRPDEPIEESGIVAVLTGLELPKSLRGRGFGRDMVDAAVKWAFSHGAEAVYTHSFGAPGDSDPTGFYEKLGFETVDMDNMGNPYMRLEHLPASTSQSRSTRTASKEPAFMRALSNAAALPPDDVTTAAVSKVMGGTLVHQTAGSHGSPSEDTSEKIQSILESGVDPSYWAKQWPGSPGEGHPKAAYLSLAWPSILSDPVPGYVAVEPKLSRPLVLWSGDSEGNYTWGPALNAATGKSGSSLSSFLRSKGYDSVITVRRDGEIGEVAYFGKKPLPASLIPSRVAVLLRSASAIIHNAAVEDIYRGVKTVIEKYGGKGLFARFSDVPKIGIRPSTEHHDPYGVYFYPVDWLAENAGFGTTYINRTYITVAKIKRSGWLNLATIRPAKARELAEKGGVLEEYKARTEGKGLNQAKGGRAGKRLWDAVEAKVKPFESKANKMEWNRIFGRMGVKAIYDPGTGSVNSAEPSQIVVLDLSLIEVVDVVENHEDRKSVYHAVLKAVADEILDEDWRVSGSHAEGGISAAGTVNGRPVAMSVMPAKSGFEMEVTLSYHDPSGRKHRIVSRGRMPNEWEDAPAGYLAEGHAKSILRSLEDAVIGESGEEDAEDILDSALRSLTDLRLPDLTVKEMKGGIEFWKNTGDGKIQGSLKVAPGGRREMELYAEDWLLFGGDDSVVIEIGPMRVSWDGDPSSASTDMAAELSRAVRELRAIGDAGENKDINMDAAAEIVRMRTLSWMFPDDILTAAGQKYERMKSTARSASLRIAKQQYWHGSSGVNIREIASAGFVNPWVPKGESCRGYQKPMSGRTYATTDLSYALIYALGAAMVGQELPNNQNFDGEGGIVLLEAGGDPLPDEDWVGELIAECESRRRRMRGDLNARGGDVPEWKENLYIEMRRQLPPEVVSMIDRKPIWKLDEMATQSMIGKNVNKWLLKHDGALKTKLVHHSPHHSYAGTMRVIKAWVFNKREISPKLEKDGSNFLKLAMEIPVAKAVSASLCSYDDYKPYSCSPSGVCMPSRVTPDIHDAVSRLFGGKCPCPRCKSVDRTASSVEDKCWSHAVEALAANGFEDMDGMCLEASVVLCERLRDEGVDARLARRWSDEYGGHWTVCTSAGEFDPTIAWWGDSAPKGASKGQLYEVTNVSPHAGWEKDDSVDESTAYRIAIEELGVDDLENLYDNALEGILSRSARRVAMPYLHEPKCPYCGHMGPQDPKVEFWESLSDDYRGFLERYYGTEDRLEIARKLMWDRTVPTYCGKCGQTYLFEKSESDSLAEKVAGRFKAWHGTSDILLDDIHTAGGLIDPYLAATLSLAEYYAGVAAENDGGSPIVLEIDIRDRSRLRYDGNAMDEPVTVGVSEADRDFEWGRAEKEHPEWVHGDTISIPADEWEYSWRGAHSVRYDGLLPSSGISSTAWESRSEGSDFGREASATLTFGALPPAVQTDITDNIHDMFFAGTDVSREILRGVLEDMDTPLPVRRLPVADLAGQARSTHCVSETVVSTLADTLRRVGDLDLVLTDGVRFLDGGHRVMAYESEGKGSIPTVDVSSLLSADWESEFREDILGLGRAARRILATAVRYWHGTTAAAMRSAERDGYLRPPVYLADSPEAAKEFAEMASDDACDRSVVLEIVLPEDRVAHLRADAGFDGAPGNFVLNETVPLEWIPWYPNPEDSDPTMASALFCAAVKATSASGLDLAAIREFLESKWAARGRPEPGQNCITTASFLSKLISGAEVRGGQPEGHRNLVRHGLATDEESRSGGGYKDDEGYLYPHLWVESNGMVYDLTADQFGGDPVTVVPSGGRYVPSELSEKNTRALRAVDAETDAWLEEWMAQANTTSAALILYHGTAIPDLDKLRVGSGAEHMRVAGVYLSKSRDEAEKYTKVAGVRHPENILTVEAKLSNPATRDTLDGMDRRLDGWQAQAELIRRGYDSVIDDLMDEVIVFDPARLRILGDRTAATVDEFLDPVIASTPSPYPSLKWVKNQLQYCSMWLPILDAYIIGSEAKGTASPDSDLDIAVIIGDVSHSTSIRFSEDFHSEQIELPDWQGRQVDFQFFYPDDPEIKEYSKIPLAPDSEYTNTTEALREKLIQRGIISASLSSTARSETATAYKTLATAFSRAASAVIPPLSMRAYRAEGSSRGVMADAMLGGIYFFPRRDTAELWAGDRGTVVGWMIDTSDADVQDVPEGEMIRRDSDVIIRRDPDGSGDVLEIVVFDDSLIHPLDNHTHAARQTFELSTLGDTVSYDDELYHGTSIKAAAAIAKRGFSVEQHGEMSCGTISLTRNPVAAQIFAGHDGVVFEFDISLHRLFVLPEFVYDAMGCYAGTGMCGDDFVRRMSENADALKRIGAVPESWDSESGEPPDWSEWRDSDMDEFGWLERSLPGYDGVVVPGFDSNHPRAEAEIALFMPATARLKESVSAMYVGEREYWKGGPETESLDDGWDVLAGMGTDEDDEEGMELDAALSKAARALGEHLGDTVTAYRALATEHAEKVMQEGFMGPHHAHGVYYTASPERAMFYSRFMASSKLQGVIFELEADTSRSTADVNDTTEWQSNELYEEVKSAAGDMVETVYKNTETRLWDSDAARLLESWLGGLTVSEGYYDSPEQHSVWQLLADETKGTDSEMTISEAKDALPPGRYGGMTVLDSRGVAGIDAGEMDGQAQAKSQEGIPADRLKAIWIPTAMLHSAGVDAPAGAETMEDYVDVIPAKFNMDYDIDFVSEIEKQRDDARETGPPPGLDKEAEEVWHLGMEAVADEMDSILDRWRDEGDSTMPGHIYSKLITGERVTPEDLDREEGFVRYPLPQGRLLVTKILRKAIARQGRRPAEGKAARRAALDDDITHILRHAADGMGWSEESDVDPDSFVDEGFMEDESGHTFWGSRGSGLLFVRSHPDHGWELLLVKRSPIVEEPNTWGTTGGAVPKDENNLFASAVRETREEIGGIPPYEAVRQYVWKALGGSFTYTTFILECTDMDWMPSVFNWEATAAQWVSLKEAKSYELHFGLVSILKDLGESIFPATEDV